MGFDGWVDGGWVDSTMAVGGWVGGTLLLGGVFVFCF